MLSIRKAFTLILVISPVLAMYHISPSSSITLLDLLLVLISILIFLDIFRNKKIKLEELAINIMPYFIYILFQFLFLSLISFNSAQIIDVGLRTVRYLFYLFIIIFMTKKYFDLEYGIKYLKYLAVFSTVFLILQIILLRGFNYYLKGYLPIFYITRENLIEFSETATNTYYTRVRSIFGEPSQYAIVNSMYLIISNFSNKKNDSLFTRLLITIGILLSASTLGIISVMFIWGLWIIYRLIANEWKIRLMYLVPGIVVGVSVLLYFITSESFALFLIRFDGSVLNRFGSYIELFNNIFSENILTIIFGSGMDLSELSVWYPSYAKIIKFFGVIGLILFMVAIVLLGLRLNEPWKKILLIYIVILGLGTEVLVGNFLLLFFPFVYSELNKSDFEIENIGVESGNKELKYEDTLGSKSFNASSY